MRLMFRSLMAGCVVRIGLNICSYRNARSGPLEMLVIFTTITIASSNRRARLIRINELYL